MTTPTKVLPAAHLPIPVSLGTKLGIAASVLTLAKPVVEQIGALVENTAVHWTSGDKISLVSGSAIIALTVLGRFGQAVVAIVKGK